MKKLSKRIESELGFSRLVLLINLLFIVFQASTFIVIIYISKEFQPEKMGMLFTYYLYAVTLISNLCLIYVIFKAYKFKAYQALSIFVPVISIGIATILGAIIIRIEQDLLFTSITEFINKIICVFVGCDVIAIISLILIYRFGKERIS